MSATKGAAPDSNAVSVEVTTILHPCDGGVPVGELSLDRQELAGLAAAVAEVPIRKRQCSDASLCEALGEGAEAHLACGTEAVPEDHHGR